MAHPLGSDRVRNQREANAKRNDLLLSSETLPGQTKEAVNYRSEHDGRKHECQHVPDGASNDYFDWRIHSPNETELSDPVIG